MDDQSGGERLPVGGRLLLQVRIDCAVLLVRMGCQLETQGNPTFMEGTEQCRTLIYC